MYVNRRTAGALVVALGLALCSARSAFGNTYVFNTAPGATVNSGGTLPVDATVEFITALNQITIRITNLQQETTGTAAQTISAVDFHLQGLNGGALNPTLFSYQGEIGDLHTLFGQPYWENDGLVYNSTGGNVGNQWSIYTNYVGPGSSRGAQIQGGIQLTALNGATNPTELILGPPNGHFIADLYTANSGLIGESPLLRTDTTTYIEYVIHFTPGSGVTSSTVVDSARMSWNNAFNAQTELNLQGTPEPGTWCLILGGLGAFAVRNRIRTRNPRSGQKR